MECSEFLSWSICAIDVGLSSCVPGRLAMAACLRAMMCFLRTRVYMFLSCFPETMYSLLADVRSWKPVMPRSISGLVMQLMRVANVGGGGLRAEVTSELEII